VQLWRRGCSVNSLDDGAMGVGGLGRVSFTILVGLANSEPVAIGVLSKTLAIDPTTMTRNLARMEKRGFLSVSARSVKRQRFVTLLPPGRKALERCMPFWRHVQEQVVSRIGPDCWKQFQADLERLSSIGVELELAARETRSKRRSSNVPSPPVAPPPQAKQVGVGLRTL